MLKKESFYLILSVSISNFFSAFNGSAINIAIPYIADDFSVEPQSVAWMINAFIITTAPFLLGASALARRFSCHRIYSIGVSLGSLSSILIAIAPSFLALIILRALQGIIFSLVFCTSIALITSKVEPEKRAMSIAYATSAVYAGLSISPLLSGFLTEYIAWESVFYLTALGHIISFYLVLKVSRDHSVSKDLAISKIVLSFIAGALFLYSLSNINSDENSILYLILSLVLFALYIISEKRSKTHLIDISILKNKVLDFALLSSLFNYMSNFAISLLLAMHLEIVQGLSATNAGLVLLIQPIFMTILSVSTAKLTHRFGANNLCIVGMAIISTAFFILSSLNKETPIYVIFMTQCLTGIGFGIFSAPNTNIVMSSVAKENVASASALQALARNTGMAICMAIVTIVLDTFIKLPSTDANYVYELSHSISICFTISTILCFIGLIFCFFTRKHGKEGHTI